MRAVEDAVTRASPAATPVQVAKATAAIADVIGGGHNELERKVAWALGAAAVDRDALANAFIDKTAQATALYAAARDLEKALGVDFAAIEQRFAVGLSEFANRLGTALPAALSAAFPRDSVDATATGYRVSFFPPGSAGEFTADIAVNSTASGVGITGYADRMFRGGDSGRVSLFAEKTPDDVAGLGAELVKAVHRAFSNLTSSPGDSAQFEASWKTWMASVPPQAET